MSALPPDRPQLERRPLGDRPGGTRARRRAQSPPVSPDTINKMPAVSMSTTGRGG